jgi:integrase
MPRVRSNGTGSIHIDKRNGKYRATYVLSKNQKTGKYIRRSFLANSYEEADEKLKLIIEKIKDGQYSVESEMKYKHWLNYWIDDCKVNTIEQTTLDNYKGNLNNHVIPWLGDIKLKDLSVKDIQRFYNHLYEDGREDGRGGLNPRTVQRIHTIINSSLKHAVRCEVLTKNVAMYAIKRKMRKFEIEPYSLDELKEFIMVTKDEDFYPLFVTSALTGLRRGEVLALRWQDVDFDTKMIKVRKSLGQRKVSNDSRKRIIELKDTKTESSRRTIPIDDFLTNILSNHKIKQVETSFKYGRDSYNPNDLVFCEKNGSFINPSKYTNEFSKVIKKLNLRKVRLHDVRHAYATIMLQEGVGHKYIKDLLGHSTIVTTLDIYTHTNITELRKASSKLSEALMI